MNDTPHALPEALLKAVDHGLQTSSPLLWNPPYCGAIDIRIAADGVWYHEGRAILRPALVRLFSSILRREADGGFYLVTPVEKLSIRVDECPFVAVLLQVAGAGADAVLAFELNTGEHISAGVQHRLWVEEREGGPHPMLEVRDGLHARLTRAVFYQLVELAQVQAANDTDMLVVWSQGQCFVLGAAD